MYASSVLLDRKKNGDSRKVIDYHKLNKQTVRTNFPSTDLDNQLTFLGENSLFIIMDLAQGNMQVLWLKTRGQNNLYHLGRYGRIYEDVIYTD